MYTSTSSVFAVNHQARAICPQHASKERHRFLVGTCSLHDENEISVLEYHEDSNSIEAPTVYSHPDQIWGLETSFSDSSLVLTSWQNSSGKKGVSLWRMPHQRQAEIESTDAGQFLGERLHLDSVNQLADPTVESSSAPCSLRWHPTEGWILTSNSRGISYWTVGEDAVQRASSLQLAGEHADKAFTSGCSAWDPHSTANCVSAFSKDFSLVDIRKMEVTSRVQDAHKGVIRDVDYNPNKPLTIITAGDDRLVKFWDVRMLSTAIKTLAAHSHWVWSARYNPFHDQLILSGGSDHAVNLWRVASCSSAPWLGSEDLDLEDEGSMSKDGGSHRDSDPPDIKVRFIDQHEDSVYGVAWSPSDAWVYCSLSVDGRIILNHVPSTEKYKILL